MFRKQLDSQTPPSVWIQPVALFPESPEEVRGRVLPWPAGVVGVESSEDLGPPQEEKFIGTEVRFSSHSTQRDLQSQTPEHPFCFLASILQEE